MSHLLKALERIIYKHIASFMENKFLPYLLGFRNQKAQYWLFKMVENSKN